MSQRAAPHRISIEARLSSSNAAAASRDSPNRQVALICIKDGWRELVSLVTNKTKEDSMSAPPSFEQQYPSIGPLIIAIADWYRQWRTSSHVSDLDNCARGDVERIAKDLGLTAGDLRALERTAHEPLLLPRMLSALKINAAEIARSEPAAFRDLQRVCALCDSKRRCETDLGEGDAAATFEAYCPNALTLKALT